MSVIEALVRLQDQDAVVRDLEQQVRDIPIRKKQEQDRLKVEEDAVEHAKAQLASLRAEKVEADARLANLNRIITDMQMSLPQIKSNREYSETLALIDTRKKDRESLEEEILALEERMAPVEETLEEARRRYDAAKSEIDGYLQELDEGLARAEAELAEARKERAALVPPLQTPAGMRFLMSYERISKDDPARRKKGKWPALVRIEDKVCQGCHMELTAAKVQEVARAKDVVLCEYCGRMIY